jgi:HAD superfamily hydrolase (TIGR01509 family)
VKRCAAKAPLRADDACHPMTTAAQAPRVDPTAWDVRRGHALRRAAIARSGSRAARRGIAVLMLDVGGVVIPSLFESVRLPDFPEGPLAAEPAWRRVERGDTTEREYWAAVAADGPDRDIAGLWQRCSRVRGELSEILDVLARSVRVVAFTNDMVHFFGEDWPSRFPELAAFDTLVDAGRLGVRKPDPEAFRAAMRMVGEAPERCLFVDDLAVNLAGARKVGMQVRLFDVRDPAGSVAALMADLGLDGDQPVGPTRAFGRAVR